MKTSIAIILSVLLVLSLAACNNSTGRQDSEPLLTTVNEYATTQATTTPTVAATEATAALATEPTEATAAPATEPTEVNATIAPTQEPAPTEHLHSYASKIVAPSCTTEGYTFYSCSCGANYTDSTTPALGHTYSQWITTQEPTYTKEGSEERKCATCSAKEARELAKLVDNHVHSYTETISEQPSCQKAGAKTFSCICGHSYTESIPTLSHSYTSTTTAATCNSRGFTEYTCSLCNDSYKDNYTDEAHNFAETVIAPTCLLNGYTRHTCTLCQAAYLDSEVPATGHSFAFTSDTAGCTTEGIKTESCVNCSETRTSPSPALGGHVEVTESAEATCYSLGYTKVSCSVCEQELSIVTTPMKDCTKKTMNVSDAAALCDQFWHENMPYITYKEWNVEACEICGSFDPYSMYFAYTDYEAAVIMLGYVNALREEVYGTDVYNLTLDNRLVELADMRAGELEYNFSHAGAPAGCGENIASGYTGIYDQFLAWKNSPGHYSNMISKSYTTFGFGIYDYTKTGCWLYGVQLFSR